MAIQFIKNLFFITSIFLAIALPFITLFRGLIAIETWAIANSLNPDFFVLGGLFIVFAIFITALNIRGN